jgi:uncharacterized membrane protein
MRAYLMGGFVAGAGAALIWRMTRRRRREETLPPEHWSTTARLAAGAIGGGLILYGTRAPGKMGRLAATAGTGLLVRCITDQPVHKLSDVIQPRALLRA